MKIERVNHQYLRVTAEENENGELLYASRVLNKKEVDGLLRLKKRNMDGQVFYYYSVESVHSMEEVWDGRILDAEMLEHFLQDLREAIANIHNYLLNQKQLFMSPSYIMYDAVKRKWKFVYLIKEYDSQKEDILELLGFFASKLSGTAGEEDQLYEYLSDCMLLGEDISVMEIVRLWMERPKVQISHSQEKNTTEGWEMSEDCIEGLNEKAEEDTDDLCTEEQHLMAWENISWKESWNSMVYEKLYLVPYSPH